jgi:hypothetical protein
MNAVKLPFSSAAGLAILAIGVPPPAESDRTRHAGGV